MLVAILAISAITVIAESEIKVGTTTRVARRRDETMACRVVVCGLSRVLHLHGRRNRYVCSKDRVLREIVMLYRCVHDAEC